MTLRHVYRKTERTAEEAARLRADRERYQRERPTPEQLLAEGGHSDFVQLGELLLLHQLTAWLRAERERQHMTLAELEEATGIDQAALSRLETGRNANPTLDTLCRVAAALGKTICCTFRDAPQPQPTPINRLRSQGPAEEVARPGKAKGRQQPSKSGATAKRPAAKPNKGKARTGKAM
jgi:transcriptional regulator with XRE-family HTH domain